MLQQQQQQMAQARAQMSPNQVKIEELRKRGFIVLPNGRVIRPANAAPITGAPSPFSPRPQSQPKGTWDMLKDIFKGGKKKPGEQGNVQRVPIPLYNPQPQQNLQPQYQEGPQYQEEPRVQELQQYDDEQGGRR